MILMSNLIHAQLDKQFVRPQRKACAILIGMLRDLIVANEEKSRIEQAIGEHFSAVLLFDERGHFITDRIPRTLIAIEGLAFLLSGVALEFAIQNVIEKPCEREDIFVEVQHVTIPTRPRGGVLFPVGM